MLASERQLIQRDDAEAKAKALLGSGIRAFEVLPGGRNNSLFKVTRAGSDICVLKCYLAQPSDPRDRLKTEFDALDFLWRSGERAIPRPLVCDPAQQIAAYSFVEGAAVAPCDAAVDAATAFAGRLRTYAALPAAKQLRGRLARHAAVAIDHEGASRYPRFVEDSLLPAAENLMTSLAERMGPIELARPIPQSARTLSPSDFGFHNALRTRAGEFVFLDFEYFGWDDPAKLAGDFLLHPGMALDEALAGRLLWGLIPSGLRGRGGMAVRLRRLYPLLGLVWCAILLNEFLPERLRRRTFAGVEWGPERFAEQIDRAEAMLAHALAAEKKFPHGR
jgi:hypothetical protein